MIGGGVSNSDGDSMWFREMFVVVEIEKSFTTLEHAFSKLGKLCLLNQMKVVLEAKLRSGTQSARQDVGRKTSKPKPGSVSQLSATGWYYR